MQHFIDKYVIAAGALGNNPEFMMPNGDLTGDIMKARMTTHEDSAAAWLLEAEGLHRQYNMDVIRLTGVTYNVVPKETAEDGLLAAIKSKLSNRELEILARDLRRS